MGETGLFKRRSVFAFFLFLGALLLVWWGPSFFTRPLQGVLSTVTLPFQNAFSWGAFELSNLGGLIRSISTLKNDKAMLQKENLRLVAEIAHLRSLQTDNDNLRQIVDLIQDGKNTMVAGEVIGRDGTGLSRELTMNRGSAHGLKVGMPVVGPGGVLVGRVNVVFPTTAEIRLLPHPESIVSAVLVTSESNGIVRGDHGLGMIFDLALQSENLKPGEAVVTSGLGDGFPRGLLLGTIESVRPSMDRLFQQAVVVSPIRFSTLRFVAVIVK